ncbi:MAG: cytochrome c biogenesis protein CcsA [Woeseiaceae bacterium]|nr:cytochrome c biogenesis protein CcsA [Woeseiaceae bacterium]
MAFAASRLPRFDASSRALQVFAVLFAAAGVGLHAHGLIGDMVQANGLSVSLAGAVSLIGLQLAVIGLFGALDPNLRGMAAGLLLLAAVATIPMDMQPDVPMSSGLSWQIQAHILIAMFAYGLLTAGAIIAIFALVQDRRLKAGVLSSGNQLFAPLETTEKMLFSVTAAGFSVLLLAVLSGFAFVENLFAQHLAHKTAFSLLALLLFGILVAGRLFAGWRGKRAVYLYLWGFAFLCVAYFGARYVLEELLNRSWS